MIRIGRASCRAGRCPLIGAKSHAHLDANLAGFLNVLEGCRHRKTDHLVFASSSSVYGANARLPFSVHDNVDHPISFYAATKNRPRGPMQEEKMSGTHRFVRSGFEQA
jgi:UDP-glucose 4-epimerase